MSEDIAVERFKRLAMGCIDEVVAQGHEELSWGEWISLMEAELENCNPSGVEDHGITVDIVPPKEGL